MGLLGRWCFLRGPDIELKGEMEKMLVTNVKATLSKLLSVNRRFSKIKAMLPANAASRISEPEMENQLKGFPTDEIKRKYWSLPTNDGTKEIGE